MKYYFAPLEGITNCFYRKAYDKYYKNIDKYYIPFLQPRNMSLHTKEEREILKENNKLSAKVIPQILSKNTSETISFINYLSSLGYDEINLNLGCPSPTVTMKNKGAGIFKNLEYLDNYLNEIFKNTKVDISIKMRLGYESIDEFLTIINIFNKYNIKELIIHPRTSLEQYSSKLHLESLINLNEKTKIDIIYNGEINSIDDIKFIEEKLPYIKGVMIGRGFIRYPDLLEDLDDNEKRNLLLKFYRDLSKENIEVFGWNNSKFYHKEIWAFLIDYFVVSKDLKKSLFKTNIKDEFISIADQIIKTAPINKNRKSIKDYI